MESKVLTSNLNSDYKVLNDLKYSFDNFVSNQNQTKEQQRNPQNPNANRNGNPHITRQQTKSVSNSIFGNSNDEIYPTVNNPKPKFEQFSRASTFQPQTLFANNNKTQQKAMNDQQQQPGSNKSSNFFKSYTSLDQKPVSKGLNNEHFDSSVIGQNKNENCGMFGGSNFFSGDNDKKGDGVKGNLNEFLGVEAPMFTQGVSVLGQSTAQEQNVSKNATQQLNGQIIGGVQQPTGQYLFGDVKIIPAVQQPTGQNLFGDVKVNPAVQQQTAQNLFGDVKVNPTVQQPTGQNLFGDVKIISPVVPQQGTSLFSNNNNNNVPKQGTISFSNNNDKNDQNFGFRSQAFQESYPD